MVDHVQLYLIYSPHQWTPLLCAAIAGHVDIVRYLVDKGADLNIKDKEYGVSDTALKVGVPNLETDLFTNVNKPCPSCDIWSAQAGKLLGNVHMCPASSQAVHVLCTSLGTPCIQELLLGHSLYTRAIAWAHFVHYTGTAWALLVHYTGTAWVLLAHYTGTVWALLVHNTGTAWVLLAHYTGTAWALLVHNTGTAWVLLAHCTGTAWVLLGTFSITIWALLVHKGDTVLVLLAH